MTDNADDIFKYLTAVNMSLGSVNLILLVYNLIWDNHMSTVILMASLFWSVSVLLSLIAMTAAGGFVNHEVGSIRITFLIVYIFSLYELTR